MAIALEIRIGYLVSEFLAHALCILVRLKTTWAISAAFFKSFSDRLDDLGILIKSDTHKTRLLFNKHTEHNIRYKHILHYKCVV